MCFSVRWFDVCPGKEKRILELFGGSCGLTPRRRWQPSSGATRSEPVFPTKREGPARGRRRHAVAVEALVPPGTARVVNRVAAVYTSAPKRRRETVFANLCTLLRHHSRSRDWAGPRVPRHRRPHGSRATQVFGPEARPTRVVTQPPTHTNLRSLSFQLQFVSRI